MKKICKLFFIFSVVLQFTACSFFNSVDEGSETRESMITLSIADDVYTNDNSRTAIPSFYESTMWTRWRLLIEDHPEVAFSQIGDSHSYKINTSIEPGTYTITAKLLDSSGLPFLSGSKSITIQSGGYYYDNIVLTYMPSGEGFVALDFKFPTSIVSHVKCIFDGNQIIDSVAIDANGTYSFTQDAVTTGTHVLNLILLKQEGTNYIPLYIISEEIIVKPNLTTSTWLVNGSSYINSSNQFELTETKLQKLISHTVYVMGTGGTLPSIVTSEFGLSNITASDSNVGTILNPYASLTASITKILTLENNEASTESVPYKIVVSGTLSGTNAQLTLDDSTNNLYLEIAGFAAETGTTDRKDVLDVNDNSHDAIYIPDDASNVYLTVKNLEIKSASRGILDAGGGSGSLTLEQCYIHNCNQGIDLSGNNTCTVSNVDITNNNGNINGAGISFVGTGNLKLKGQVSIYENKKNATLSNVYVDNATKLELIGPVTSDNGIYISNYKPTATNPLVTFTQNYKTYNSSTNPSTFFHSDEGYTIGWNAEKTEAALGIVAGNIKSKVIDDVTFVPSGISFKSGQEKIVTITPKINGTEIVASELSEDNFKMGVTSYGTGITVYDEMNGDSSKPCFTNANKNIIKFPDSTPAEGLVVWATYKFNDVLYSCSIPMCRDITDFDSYSALPERIGVSDQEGLEKIKTFIEETTNQRFSNKIILIGNDIVVGILPRIGSSNNQSFCGTIDGNGHTITVESFEEGSLIYSLNGKIKNLTFASTDTITINEQYFAPFAYLGVGTIENCTNKCNITSIYTGGGCLGGIVAYPNLGYLYIKNCVNEGNLVVKQGQVGGIVAFQGNTSDKKLIITNCINKGDVTSELGYAGGIASSFIGCIVNCINMGNVTATSNAGGIVASMTPRNNGIMYGLCNNYNCGTVMADGNTGGNAGGICGVISNSTATVPCNIKNCVNSGEIKKNTESSNPSLGGILGKSSLSDQSKIQFDNNYYISSASYTGCGNLDDSITSTSFTSFNTILTNLNGWVTSNPTVTYNSVTCNCSLWRIKTVDGKEKFELTVLGGE